MVAVFEAGLRVGVVVGDDRDGHRILRQQIHADDVVREKGDRIDHRQPAIDVEREPIVGVDRALHRVGHRRLHEAATRAAFSSALATGSARPARRRRGRFGRPFGVARRTLSGALALSRA